MPESQQTSDYVNWFSTQEDLSNLSLKTDGFITFETGEGPINLRVNLRDSVLKGKCLVESHNF